MLQACDIFHSGLSYGVYRMELGNDLAPVVWLTTSPSWKNHGLPEGSLITGKGDLDLVRQREGVSSKTLYSMDKTKIRIDLDDTYLQTLDISAYRGTDRQDWSGLIDFEKFSKYILRESKNFRNRLGHSTDPSYKAFSKDERTALSCKKPKNISTWKLYFGSIQPERFMSVKYREGNEYVPFDFFKHGYSAMESSGVVYLREKYLKQFHGLCPPINDFEVPKIAAFCTSADSIPHLICKYGESSWIVYLDEDLTVELTRGVLPENIDNIRTLVSNSRIEAERAWDIAVKRYQFFYK